VLGAMPELGRVRLADPFVTTSSLMPHKRNPDLAELVRGETGPAVGRLTAHLALLKGLPLAYNRDLQVGKPILFEGMARGGLVLDVLAPMIRTAEFLPAPERPGGRPAPPDTASVELVDALVAVGVPFRVAHTRVARLLAEVPGGLEAGAIARAFPELKDRPFRLPSAEEEPERRRTEGGSARREVDRLLRVVERRRSALGRSAERERRRLERLHAALDAERTRAHRGR
jgi:argininosuccinate lyase